MASRARSCFANPLRETAFRFADTLRLAGDEHVRPEGPTRYKPNLSEDEPLFSASTFSSASTAGLSSAPSCGFQRQSRTSGMSWPCSLI